MAARDVSAEERTRTVLVSGMTIWIKSIPYTGEADIVVLATPLYYWTISGQLKSTFNRLFAVAECDPNYRNPKKESALIMAAEGYGFEETLYWYDRLEKHLGWKSIGKVLCGGVMAVGDIAPFKMGMEKIL